MSKLLNEQKVLKKLKIPDFRHLTKDKVIAMASLLDKMDPEVAKKALEQFPEFSVAIKEMLTNYKETLDKGLENNRESVQAYYSTCNIIIETLKKELESETLSFDERKYIITQMSELSKQMGEKDSENKKFIATMSVIFGGVVLGLGAILASTLGGNTKIETYDDDDTNDNIAY